MTPSRLPHWRRDGADDRLLARARAIVARRRSSAGEDPDARERGDTLVEVLLALVILGLAAVALIVAFQTSITASSEHRNLSKVTAAISDVTATVYSQVRVLDAASLTNLFATQQSLLSYQTDFDSLLTTKLQSIDFTVHVVSVQFWDPTQKDFPPVNTATGESAFTAFEPQLMTVDMTNNVTGRVTVHGVVLADPTQLPAAVAPSGPTQLQFFVQPSGATLNTPFTNQPVVAVEDSSGNIITTALPYLTIGIVSGTGTSGANLSSSCTAVPNGAGLFVYSGCSIDQLGNGYQLVVTAPYVTIPGATPPNPTQTSAPFDVSPVQLLVPTIMSVAPSTTTAGALAVNFTGSSNAPTGQDYVVTACSDPLMTSNCQTVSNFAPGIPNPITGLTPGRPYWVQVEAFAGPNSGYISSTSPPTGPTPATVQLAAPSVTALGYGPVAGSINVNFTGSSNAPSAQTYTAVACTTASTPVCTTFVSAFAAPATSGQLTTLAFTPGAAGTAYTVTLSADASTGYLASAPSAAFPAHNDTSVLNPVTSVTVTSSTTKAGAVTASFVAPTGTPPVSYNATACTDAALTSGCVMVPSFVSGGQITGLTPGTSYFVNIYENPPAGYVATSATSAMSAAATIQLSSPTVTSLGYGTTAGSLTVNFAGAAPVLSGQTYTAVACTTASTPVCTTFARVFADPATSGQLTALAFTPGVAGTAYTVTLSEDASPGYLASSPSAPAGPQAVTSQFAAPSVTSLGYGTTGGSLAVNFSATAPLASAQTYSAVACTTASTPICTTFASVFAVPATTGQLTGLAFTPGVAGTPYTVTLSADAATGFVASAPSAAAGPQADTSQFAAPSVTSLAYGTTAGSLVVNFSATTPVVSGQTYTAVACDSLTNVCTVPTPITSGAQLTGLTFTQGLAGDPYTVTVVANANASAGYLASAPSAAVAAHNDTSKLNAPSNVAVTSSTTAAGAVAVSFFVPSEPATTTYSALACTTSTMTGTCVGPAAIAAGGGQVTGLTPGTSYFVQVTASTTTPGFVNAQATSPTAAPATTQLSAPVINSLGYGSSPGSLAVNFTDSSNSPMTQTYTAVACTTASTPVCTTFASVFAAPATSGQLTGLAYTPGVAGTSYTVTLSADPSAGYLASAASASAGPHADTSELSPVTALSVTPGTSSISVSFSAPTSGPTPASYSAEACTNSQMTVNCSTITTFSSGSPMTGTFTGLSNLLYYVSVTDVGNAQYASNTVTYGSAVQG